MRTGILQSLAVVLVFGITAGIDNFQAGCALGMLPLTRNRKLAFGASFGLCETASSLAGLVAGQLIRVLLLPERFAGAIVLLISGGTILYLSWTTERAVDNAVNDGWMICGLPVLLSLDNLVAGAGLGAIGFPPILSALIIGTVCSALSFAGILLGGCCRLLVPKHASLISGVWLVTLAIGSIIRQGSG